MNVVVKMLRYSSLAIAASVLLSQPATFGYSDDHNDHTNHTESSTSTTVHNQTDCASACPLNSQLVHPAGILNETRRKIDRQPQPDPEPIKEVTRKPQPVIKSIPKPCILPTQEIYKYKCAYLF